MFNTDTADDGGTGVLNSERLALSKEMGMRRRGAGNPHVAQPSTHGGAQHRLLRDNRLAANTETDYLKFKNKINTPKVVVKIQGVYFRASLLAEW